jgi:hypothetical protein
MPRLLLLFILFTTSLFAQFTDRYWAFGDSAAIDFKNLTNPQPANSILRVRGTCASICDSVGDLLFYCGSPNWARWLAINNIFTDGTVVNKNHVVKESVSASSQKLEAKIIIANEKLICSDKLVRRKKLLQQINLPFQIMFLAIEIFY